MCQGQSSCNKIKTNKEGVVMKIDIQHIAKLARLEIEDDQIPVFEKSMEKILDMIKDIPEAKSTDFGIDIEHPMELREDIPRESLRRDALLANAPKVQAGCVVVPKTVE